MFLLSHLPEIDKTTHKMLLVYPGILYISHIFFHACSLTTILMKA